VGYLESGLCFSAIQLTLANELIGYARRVNKSEPFDPEQLAIEAIHQVGPGGAFINHAHTHRHFRDNWFAELIDRDTFGGWEKAGSTTLLERTRAKAQHLLKTHQPTPLTPDSAEIIDEIVARVQASLRKE
jgi:trimethylamine--corrinoid protein Co-methyltransferase